MKKNIIFKIMSVTLSVIMVLPFVSEASDSHFKENQNYEINQTVRSNLNFEVGKPGDNYLVYTYTENEKDYKVIEFSDMKYKNVYSEIYIKNDVGNYVHHQNKETQISDNGIYSLTTVNSNGKVNVEESSLPKEEINYEGISPKLVSQYYTDPGTGKWLYRNFNGNARISNMTIAGIASVLGTAVSIAIGGPTGVYVGNALSAIAASYFSVSADRAYYRVNYKWMMSKLQPVALVLRENAVTNYYLDSGHRYHVGRDVFNWDGRW